MRNSLFKSDDFFTAACKFETSLILVAIFLGWIAGINPFTALHFSASPIVYGVIGTAPLFLMFLGLQQMQGESIVNIRKFLLNTLGPSLHAYQWPHLLLLGGIAGLSEELLFRGVIQPWIESSWGMLAGLLGSNVIFGLLHAVTPLYAVLAAAVGIYLGWSLDYGGGRNLLTPILIHGLYDFLAFVALMRTYRASLLTAI
ncbi:MAG: type II CAAX endopeptidase family protein [Methylovulum sp.]|nr:type II CAAX endopeptidase family protein [Methylovulum sp.]